MSEPASKTWLLFELAVIAAAFVLSLLLSARFMGHLLSIGGCSITRFSLLDLRYSHCPSRTESSIARASFAFHLPTRTKPVWGTFTAHGVDHTDTTCTVSVATVTCTLLVLPVYLRQSAGPLAVVELADFRLRVPSSTAYPSWVSRLRRNLVSTILTGSYLRVDDVKTTLMFAGLDDGAKSYDAQTYKPGVPNGAQQDEWRADAGALGLHILNWQDRVYSFGAVNVQMRRSWVEERGTFVMVALDSRWVKVQSELERETVPRTPLWHLWYTVVTTPGRLVRLIHDPLSYIDLYVPRADITFDEFRLRDAELVRQGGAMIKEQLDAGGQDWKGFLWDMFVHGVLGAMRCEVNEGEVTLQSKGDSKRESNGNAVGNGDAKHVGESQFT